MGPDGLWTGFNRMNLPSWSEALVSSLTPRQVHRPHQFGVQLAETAAYQEGMGNKHAFTTKPTGPFRINMHFQKRTKNKAIPWAPEYPVDYLTCPADGGNEEGKTGRSRHYADD